MAKLQPEAENARVEFFVLREVDVDDVGPPRPIARMPRRKQVERHALVAKQPDLIDHLGDRDALFALLSRVLPWAQASAATAALVERYGSLTDTLAAPEQELAAIGELGPSAAGVLKVAHAAALRLVSAPIRSGPVLAKWRELEAYLVAAMAREPVEHARVLFLNTRNHLIADEIVAVGGPRSVVPEPREIARRAVQLHATAIILVHNHPSGDPTPSLDDVEVTRAMQKILSNLDIIMHDHIIVARGGVISLRSLRVFER